MKKIKAALAILLSAVMVLSFSVSAFALAETELQEAVDSSAAYMVGAVPDPQVGSIGGEWAIIGLARSGAKVPENYYETYYATLESYVKACKGVLHEKKYTEYSRVILALSAIGKDPRNVAGYNLLTALGDYDKTVWQGLNGPIWALLALDSRNYDFPVNPAAKIQASRQMYVDRILEMQLPSGGWNLTGAGSPDPDVTGMALQALAGYQNRAEVKAASDKAVAWLSSAQDASGGYESWGVANSESAVQVLVALCELGIDLNDPRFVKGGHSLLDNIMSYRRKDGGFMHTKDGSGNNQMSAEQGLYGLAAALRAASGGKSLYDMSDAISIGESSPDLQIKGLPGKNPAVRYMPIVNAGSAFDDIYLNPGVAAIESLASRGIISGMGAGKFMPDKTMTRAEFAAIVTKALGLEIKSGASFADVAPSAWHAPYVGTAAAYGIVSGVGGGRFNPRGVISRQEAAAMVSNAAKLCGLSIAMSAAEIRDVLAQFGDYMSSDAWARPFLAFCYKEGILDASVLDIEPSAPVRRWEIARMIFNMLGKARLL